MNRDNRGIRAAVKAASQSHFRCHRVGAALFKGRSLIAMGWNKKKTHPKNSCILSRHGEFDTLIKLPLHQIMGARLYIARLTRTGKVSYSKPCKHCLHFLKALPLDRIYYTNYTGNLEKVA